MSPKIFFSENSLFIPASKPYPDDTFYKISIGQQKFNDRFHDVVKIEMIYNGELGRGGKANPAFPCESDDLKKVIEEILKFI